MKKLSALFIILFFFASFSITLASVPKGITLNKTSDGYSINFLLPSYQLNTVTAENQQFYTIDIPGYGIINEIGLPALPRVSFNMFIPYD